MTMSLDVGGYTEAFDESDYNSLDKTNRDQVNAWLESEHPRRGDIQVTLISPLQTRSILLPFRRYDFVNAEGYRNWPFMSVLHWGEIPQGQWTLAVHFNSSEGFVEVSGVSMELYGTAEKPAAVRSIPAQCHQECRRGCSGEGPENCDACQRYRVAATLECVSVCPPGTMATADEGYCLETGAAADNFTNAGYDDDNLKSTTASLNTDSKEDHLSAKYVRRNASNTVTLAAALGGGLVAMILLVVLILLLCVLIFIALRRKRGPMKYVYEVFKDSIHSRSSSDDSSSFSACSMVDSSEPFATTMHMPSGDNANKDSDRTNPSIV